MFRLNALTMNYSILQFKKKPILTYFFCYSLQPVCSWSYCHDGSRDSGFVRHPAFLHQHVSNAVRYALVPWEGMHILFKWIFFYEKYGIRYCSDRRLCLVPLLQYTRVYWEYCLVDFFSGLEICFFVCKVYWQPCRSRYWF